jgi:rod shape-determining protein MreC
VGEVTESYSATARVRLLTSPKISVPVRGIKTKTKGILSGEFGSGLKMREILTDRAIDPGERIITTGVNSSFPFGLNVGSVEEVISVESELTKQAKIESKIRFNDLEHLFVIID